MAALAAASPARGSLGSGEESEEMNEKFGDGI